MHACFQPGSLVIACMHVPCHQRRRHWPCLASTCLQEIVVQISTYCPQATFGSEKREGSDEYVYEAEALSKRHSMTHEAVESGRRAGAYRTILTHFSQRYPKIPVIDDTFRASTCIAFDLMSVNLQGQWNDLLIQPICERSS